MSKSVKIAITQMNVSPDALGNRLKRAEDLVRKAAAQGALIKYFWKRRLSNVDGWVYPMLAAPAAERL